MTIVVNSIASPNATYQVQSALLKAETNLLTIIAKAISTVDIAFCIIYKVTFVNAVVPYT